MATKKTTTTSSTTAKPSSTTGAPASGTSTGVTTAVKPAAPKPVIVSTNATPLVAEADLKKKELIELVTERSGLKKRDVKPVVEATLAILGETIAEGRELNLQPFGKLRINRTEDKANGRVTVCKLRQSKSVGKTPKEPIAKPAE